MNTAADKRTERDRERGSSVRAYLNSVVIRIGNNNTIRIRYGYIMRMLQLTLATSAGTEFTNEGTIGLENLTRCETETERNETRACVYKFFNSVARE